MIGIRYYNGEISIDPESYFDSKNATIGKFRKLVKLSFESILSTELRLLNLGSRLLKQRSLEPIIHYSVSAN